MTNSATSLHYIGHQVNHKENLEVNVGSAVQNNPFLVVLLGGFNAKSSNWCKNDLTTSEGKAV